ncbi:hydroxymethylglutaryl-CoA lyase [Aquincola sp. J276]|uniref:hydroxymethylglutaryl-CoA lyase n=1 Tax=Aquincola sp. J276 TaxID=2898432 RepID=UPI002150972A|nr:hydroxymethylglutaryl-CoA lyase [Aquincola sp. J276]MCR5867711.1 hydroxymethylglutaryl-CoA lyase [Aquincola sp. J276]
MPSDTPLTPVAVRDTSLRDGLQSIARTVPTDTKLQWLQGLYQAGLRQLEVGSFVPPRLMPQLADTATIVQAAGRLPGLQVTALVPNLRGAEAALAAGAHVMLLPLSASHAHSLANLRKTPDDVVAELGRIRAARDSAGSPCRIELGISTAFGCTLQGVVEPREVLRLVAAGLDAGADEVSLADTVGYAGPQQVRSLFDAALRLAGERLTTAHFHDTRGLGAANVVAAWQAGIRRFDACAGGIGGCPHAPGASGNVATEDLAWLFASMGVPTGLQFDALMSLRGRLAGWLAGEPLHGAIWRAGLPRTLLAQPIEA